MLGHALALWVATAHAKGIHVAHLALVQQVLKPWRGIAVAIGLHAGSAHHTGAALRPRQLQHAPRSQHQGIGRLDGMLCEELRCRGAGGVNDVVDGALGCGKPSTVPAIISKPSSSS